MSASIDRKQATNLFVWPALAIVIVIWPAVSCFPVFSVIENGQSATWITVQLLFLATSFWGVVTFPVFTALTLADDARPAFRALLRGRLPAIAVYAIVWMSAYAAVSLYGRP